MYRNPILRAPLKGPLLYGGSLSLQKEGFYLSLAKLSRNELNLEGRYFASVSLCADAKYTMRLGIGVRDITPPVGSTTLAGWSSRGGKLSEGKYDELTVRSVALSCQGRKGLLVTLDLLGLNRKLNDEISARLSEEFNIPSHRILITSSHTHSGPPSGYIDAPLLKWLPEGDYPELLSNAVVDSCREALDDLETCQLYLGRGKCNVGINRRRLKDDRAYLAPNEEGIRDDEVIAIKVTRKDGTVKAILFHYACHPTTVYSNYITADYPGEAKRVIERELGEGPVAIFLQGCCGDVRPRLIDGERFRSGTIEDSRRFGEELGLEVVKLCQSDPIKLSSHFSSSLKEVELPFAEPLSQEEIREKLASGNEREQRWAQVQLEYGDAAPTSVPFRIQRFNLAKELSLVALEGEVCVGYQIMTKALSDAKLNLAVGYSNGCIGYVPTAQIIGEGGYEGTSLRDWGAPAVFSTEIENILMEAIRDITTS
jgi:hypothetical protein